MKIVIWHKALKLLVDCWLLAGCLAYENSIVKLAKKSWGEDVVTNDIKVALARFLPGEDVGSRHGRM